MLTELGFERSEDDPYLYIHGNNTISWILIHVDDVLIMCISLERIMQIINALNKKFNIVDLEDVKYYLGINIRRNQQGDFTINQSNYIQKVLRRTRLDQAKPSTFPMDPGYEKLSVDSQEIKSDHYTRLIGALLLISVHSRPDISALIALLAQHIKQTKQVDWIEVQRVCRYLKGTIDYELKLSHHGDPERRLLAYADANWSEDRDTRKSNSGFVIKLFGGTIA